MIWTDEDIKKLATAVADELEKRKQEPDKDGMFRQIGRYFNELNNNENPFLDKQGRPLWNVNIEEGKIFCKDCGDILRNSETGNPILLSRFEQMAYLADVLKLPPHFCSCNGISKQFRGYSDE